MTRGRGAWELAAAGLGLALAGGLAGALAGAVGGCSRAPAGPPRPNVVWISVDTLRADRLSCYGNERATSPRIDRLAAEGVLFERALSTTSWTLPAHLSMLTGLFVSAHGVCVSDYLGESPLRGTFVSETLSQAGYATGGFYAHAFLERPFFLERGWDTWERTGRTHRESLAIRAAWEAAQAAGDQELARELRERHGAMYEQGAPEADDAVDCALRWVDARDPERPFFLFLHLFDVHTPYKAPEPYYAQFDPDYAGELEEVDVDDPSRPVNPGMDPRDLHHVMALYDGEIAWVDAQIGRLLDALESRGLAEQALVVLTSDHGDEFLEHGGSGHHHTLYQELVHVPLIVRWPVNLPAGRRVEETVSIVDIAPTLLAALELEHRDPLPGIDLFELVRGQARHPERVILSELRRLAQRPEGWLVSLVRGQEQFIVTRPGSARAELERVDLARGSAAAPEALDWNSPAGEFVAAELDRQREALSLLRARSTPRPGQAAAPDALEAAELAALGYAEFDPGDQDGGLRLCLDGCQWPDR